CDLRPVDGDNRRKRRSRGSYRVGEQKIWGCSAQSCRIGPRIKLVETDQVRLLPYPRCSDRRENHEILEAIRRIENVIAPFRRILAEGETAIGSQRHGPVDVRAQALAHPWLVPSVGWH